MKRRDFLKSLAGFAASAAFPVSFGLVASDIETHEVYDLSELAIARIKELTDNVSPKNFLLDRLRRRNSKGFVSAGRALTFPLDHK